MVSNNFVIIFITLSLVIENGQSKRLNDFIQHYESLNYDTNTTPSSSSSFESLPRTRRWVWPTMNREPFEEYPISLKFKVHDIQLNIKVKGYSDVYNSKIKIGIDENYSSYFMSKLFKGYVEGIPESYVFGSIINGIFDGKIVLPNGTFYVERASKYFPLLDKVDFHSIIYSERDLNYPRNDFGHNYNTGKERLESIQSQVTKYLDILKFVIRTSNGLGDGENLKNKNWICPIQITTDHKLWSQISDQLGSKSEDLITSEIIAIVGKHTEGVNEIFSNTRFERNDERLGNIQLVIKSIRMLNEDHCRPGHKVMTDPLCLETDNADKLLQLHSKANFDSVCLSFLFTFRDLYKWGESALGVSWIGPPFAAGVCSKQTREEQSSFNTGVVTLNLRGILVPPRASELTFAHELGHSFGAKHDPGECQPGPDVGYYLMFGKASNWSNFLENNKKFSKCSVLYISEVLHKVLDSRRDCFEVNDDPFCGNHRVDPGEECDCGFDTEECKDNCCYPRLTNGSRFASCQRKPGAKCCPSEGPCCQATTCQFLLISESPCREESECAHTSYCDGVSAKCPTSPKPDLTECNHGSKVCVNGECKEKELICPLKFGLKNCSLSSRKYTDKGMLCRIGCIGNKGCQILSELSVPGITIKHDVSLPPGSPCNKFKGFCDDYGECQPLIVNMTSLTLQFNNFRHEHPKITTALAVSFMFVIGTTLMAAVVKKYYWSNQRILDEPIRKFTQGLING